MVKLLEVGAALLAASGVIISAYLTIEQSKEAVEQLKVDRVHNDNLRKQQKEKEQLEESFRLIEKWDDPHFLNAREFSRGIGDIASDLAAKNLIQKINECQKLRGSISLMLNYFDFIRLSIEHERVNADIVKKQVGPIALVTLDRFKAWTDTLSPDHIKDINAFKKLMS